MRDATVLMSGGIDSAACAHLLAWQGNAINAVNAVFINYGQAAAAAEERPTGEQQYIFEHRVRSNAASGFH